MKNVKYVTDSIAVLATAVAIDLSGLENIISIICLCLTCLSILIGVVFKIIDKVKEAKKDGVITSDEVIDIVNTGKDGVDEICQKIEEEVKHNNNK